MLKSLFLLFGFIYGHDSIYLWAFSMSADGLETLEGMISNTKKITHPTMRLIETQQDNIRDR